MNYKIVDYCDSYCDDVSDIITRNLMEINIKDYGIEKVKKEALRFTPEMIAEYSKTRKFYIALSGENTVGTIAIVKNIHGGEKEFCNIEQYPHCDWFTESSLQHFHNRQSPNRHPVNSKEENPNA